MRKMNMIKPILTAAFAGLLLVSGCQSRGKANDGPLVVHRSDRRDHFL
jgi:outer membrane murein-binding lipoprotein Lpp